MEITFRNTKIREEDCLVIENNVLKYVIGNRFPFHSSTYNFFKNIPADFDLKEESGIQKAICHSYSFKSMVNFLCWAFKDNNQKWIRNLLTAIYLKNKPDDSDTFKEINNEDYNLANNICKKILATNSQEDYNRLLYVLNNALPNLRVGYADYNSSIGDAYDPKDWKYVPQSVKEKNECFMITDEDDIYRLYSLINIPSEPTFYFYTAETGGEPILYSSNNEHFHPINEMDKNNTPIAIPNGDGGRTYVT